LATGNQFFRYGVCYQPAGGGAMTNFAGDNFSIGQVTTTRHEWTAAATVVPGAGTWNVGFCVRNDGPTSIVNNDYVNGWVMVTNE
jgi:hypothetical protein